MPLYDFQCVKCETVKKDCWMKIKDWDETAYYECSKCKRLVLHRLVLVPPAVDDWGQGKYFEHLSPRGETFYSRKSFKKYLRDHGLREMSSYVD